MLPFRANTEGPDNGHDTTAKRTGPRSVVRLQGALTRYQVIAVGASAGGFNSIGSLLATLPSDFPCAVLVVQHLKPDHRSSLAQLMARRTKMRVQQASDGERLLPGVVYVGPPDVHMRTEGGHIRLSSTPCVNNVRPAIDVMFESVAADYGGRAIAIVLSGSGRDGASGLRAVKNAGGYTIVEDPKDAPFSAMPLAAIATDCADRIVPLRLIAAALIELSQVPLGHQHKAV